MSEKTNLKNKVAAGAALVVLSGFVPQITNNRALAATSTLTVSGSFTSGIKLSAGTNVQFATMIATNISGKATINPGGVAAISKGFFVAGGSQKDGSIKFAAGASAKVTFTVTGMKNTLALASVSGVKQGTVNLPTINITGPYAGTEVYKAATTTNTATLTSTTADLLVGAEITWGNPQPIGSFAQAIKLVVSF